MRSYLSILFIAVFLPVITFGQVALDKDSMANTPVKSTLSYEALTQFFQSTFSTGKNGGFEFKSSLFGIQKLFSKKDLDFSDYYLRRKPARNLEFSAGINKDDNGNMNTLSAGFKYALINHRSKSDINFLDIPEIATKVKNMGDAQYKAEKLYQAEIDKQNSPAVKLKMQKAFDDALKKYTKTQKLKDLPDEMEKIVDSIVISGYNGDPATFFQLAQDSYDIAAKKIDQKGLLTFGFTPGYDWNDRRFANTELSLHYLKGFGNFKKPWNIDAQIINYFSHDTTATKKNLSRTMSTISIGVNKTLLNDNASNPIIEFEMAFEDDYIHSGRYVNEERNTISLNTILRIHISREISVPVTLKYDLQHPSLLGFIKVDWNLENNRRKS
jgi:hypothetical protein